MSLVSDIFQLTLSSAEALKLCVAITRCSTAHKSERPISCIVSTNIVQVDIGFDKTHCRPDLQFEKAAFIKCLMRGALSVRLL